MSESVCELCGQSAPDGVAIKVACEAGAVRDAVLCRTCAEVHDPRLLAPAETPAT